MTQAPDDVRQAIRVRSDLFEKHFAASNAAALVADYYVAEPMMSAPDSSLLRGRAAIAALFTEVMKGFVRCRLVQVEVRAGGDLAYEVSRALLEPREPGVEPTECRYMIAWRRTPDGWRVEMDFFSWGKLL
ncbi:YybH family protein [Steroidobacter flavus]|uniref:YybH family protein n=1 Tax=Steroidobacter flavus TaxID=1842136 RepID=A0ABV8T541_9GAMM